jgi:hypothetical protein
MICSALNRLFIESPSSHSGRQDFLASPGTDFVQGARVHQQFRLSQVAQCYR